MAFFGVSSAQANFEVPYIDGTNSLSTAEFRGVWMFNRGYKSFNTQKKYNGFEAYAVGYDTNPANGAVDANGNHSNGVFYYYNGSVWTRVLSPMLGANEKMRQMNAIVGQTDYNYGNPDFMMMVGENGRADIMQYYDEPGVTSFSNSNRFYVRNPDVATTNDFYAVDAEQRYGGNFLAGGQKGLYAVITNGSFQTLNVSVTGDGARTTLNANENITGVRFANTSTVYVVTSTFQDDDRYSTAGKSCSGNQVARLYKTTNGSSTFQYLGQIGHCAYGISVGQRYTASGAEKYAVWIATSNGVYRYDELLGGGITGPMTGTSGVKTYSVSAIPDRGGDGVNLLNNGGFETWNGTSPAQWIQYDAPAGKNNVASFDGGTCGKNTFDIRQDLGQNSATSIKIQPGAAYYTDNSCVPSNHNPHATAAVSSRVDLTSTEGQIFKISGDYKVSFPSLPSADSGLPTATAQGGVSIGCTEANISVSPVYVGCSYHNRSLIRTIGNPTNGWQHFEITVSRNNVQFSQILNTATSGEAILPRRMYLEVKCEATFGASVNCDNLSVTEVSNPPIPTRDTYVVTAVGENRAILTSMDATAASPTYTAEQQPDYTGSASTMYLSAFGLAPQHLMVVGESSTILSRTPSTLKGYIWAGTSDTSSTPGITDAGVGAISVSCLNTVTSIGGQSQTLCQQEQSSYGLQLSVGSSGSGSLTGRAWFGKSIGTITDQEQRSLGSCQRSDILTDPTNLVGSGSFLSQYDVHGMCNTSAHRCFASRAASQQGAAGALSNYSCLSDFDCYGRCQKDQGTLCVVDNDCTIGATTNPPTFQTRSGGSFNPLAVNPSASLGCSSSSVLGCTAIGWLTFDSKDLTDATTPDGTSFGVSFNSTDPTHNAAAATNLQGRHELKGWARFMTLANSLDPNYNFSGWVKLRGPEVVPQGKLFACRDCYGSNLDTLNCAFCRDEKGSSCSPSNATVPYVNSENIRVNRTEAQCYYTCSNDITKKCVTDSNCSDGGSCKPTGFCSGNTSIPCMDNDACTGNGICELGAVCSISGASCQQYGVNMSQANGKMVGYAWSEDFGWLDFSDVQQANARFFQTKLGDIYATKDIGSATQTQPVGINNCNATFLILSGGTIASNWCSAFESSAQSAGLSSAKSSNVTPIQLPSSANVYRNVLGRFDLIGMETVVGNGKNKYGSPVVPLQPSGTEIAAEWRDKIGSVKPLGGKVYTVGDGTSTYTIGSSLSFIASSQNLANDGSGAGVLVVNGNLTINSGISYTDAATLTDSRALQNLVIVVKGNLTIDDSVSSLVGAYYVTGTIHTASSPSTNSSPQQQPLEIRGLVIAKEFDLGRTVAGTVERPTPSELIIADGRIQANPMPGMTDFVKSLPALTAQP
jgi:hypothetical protein